MAIKCYIGGVDVSEYLKQIDVTPGGGGGVVGSGKLYLDQQAGGLDLRPMMKVQVWQTHTGDAGVATKGRLFGGHVNVRDTGNVGTTKLWSLNAWDHSILLHKIVRDRQTSKAVVLTADTFGAQISTLIQQIQRNGGPSVRTAIEATIRVADLWPTMPAVTYAGGRKLGWYIQQLCDTVHLLDDTIFPHFYMDVSNSYGILESFDTPYLVVYDGALLPLPSLSFSDGAPAGGRKDIFGTFKRVTDATAMSQRRQSRFLDTVYTAANAVSQDTYPCEYINHGENPGGNSGSWMNEAIEDTQALSPADAQARLDAIVASESTPRETFEFETPERVLPGETIGLGWTLEGIADDTEYTIAKVQVKIEPPDVLWSKVTVNARRLGLFENNLAVFAAPVEGDDIPPLPPTDFDLASNVFDPLLREAVLSFDIDASPSPDAAGYRIKGLLGSEDVDRDVGTDLTPSLVFHSGLAYSLNAYAYDNAGNLSDPSTATLTGTTATYSSAPDPPVLVSVYTGVAPKSGGYARVHLTSTETDGGGVAYAQRLTGDLTDQPIIPSYIPPNFDSPYIALFPNLTVGAQYRFSAIVFDELGVPNSIASNTIDAIVQPVPDPDRRDGGFDNVPVDDDGLRGLTVAQGTIADFTFDTDATYTADGYTALRIHNLATETSEVLGPPISWKEGESGAFSVFVRQHQVGGGFPAQPASIFLVHSYDGADVELGTFVTIFNGTVGSTYLKKEEKFTAIEAGTKYVRWGIGQVQDATDSGWDSLFSFPSFVREIQTPALAPGSVTEPIIGALAVTVPKLDLRTDSGTRIEIKDDSGNVQMGIYYNSGPDTVVFETDDEGTANIELRATDGFLHIGNAFEPLGEVFTNTTQMRAPLLYAQTNGVKFPDLTIQTTAANSSFVSIAKWGTD